MKYTGYSWITELVKEKLTYASNNKTSIGGYFSEQRHC